MLHFQKFIYLRNFTHLELNSAGFNFEILMVWWVLTVPITDAFFFFATFAWISFADFTVVFFFHLVCVYHFTAAYALFIDDQVFCDVMLKYIYPSFEFATPNFLTTHAAACVSVLFAVDSAFTQPASKAGPCNPSATFSTPWAQQQCGNHTKSTTYSIRHRRSYVAPAELQPVIDSLRQSIGKVFILIINQIIY